MIRQFFDTMIIASSNKECLWQPIQIEVLETILSQIKAPYKEHMIDGSESPNANRSVFFKGHKWMKLVVTILFAQIFVQSPSDTSEVTWQLNWPAIIAGLMLENRNKIRPLLNSGVVGFLMLFLKTKS